MGIYSGRGMSTVGGYDRSARNQKREMRELEISLNRKPGESDEDCHHRLVESGNLKREFKAVRWFGDDMQKMQKLAAEAVATRAKK